MLRCLLWALAAAVQPKALLIADNLCLRQQLLVLQRRMPRPQLEDADWRFWILACRRFSGWQTSLLVVKPETVLRCTCRAQICDPEGPFSLAAAGKFSTFT